MLSYRHFSSFLLEISRTYRAASQDYASASLSLLLDFSDTQNACCTCIIPLNSFLFGLTWHEYGGQTISCPVSGRPWCVWQKHIWRLKACHSSLFPSAHKVTSVPAAFPQSLCSHDYFLSSDHSFCFPREILPLVLLLFWSGTSRNWGCMDEKKKPPSSDPSSAAQYAVSIWKSFIRHSRNK